MLPAFQYHPEAYDTATANLNGRLVASESMLRGWLRHGTGPRATAWTWDAAHATPFTAFARQVRPGIEIASSGPEDSAALEEAGALWLPGPLLGEAAWARTRRGDDRWSIVGTTHTTASHTVMDAIAELATAPVQPWDALICTSLAVRATVEHILDATEAQLGARLGATRFVRPQLPVIPLGIHTDAFAFTPTQRTTARKNFGIARDAIAIVQLGRIALHGKAHPVPTLLALEQAAQRTGRQLHLILAGFFVAASQEALYREWAAAFAPSVKLVVADARVAKARDAAWAASDIFTLFADNVQETFGLAPVEAMAAGLPVVVSDWDGFKDTVGEGVHGFRIPTLTPAAGAGEIIADRFADSQMSYDQYMAACCQSAAVDIDAAALAFATLIDDADLRARMGAAARAHAIATFDWAAIIPRYEALLGELAALRPATPAAPPSRRPTRDDPFALFAAYPTATLAPDMIVRATQGPAINRFYRPALVLMPDLLLDPPALSALLLAAGTDGAPLAALGALHEPARFLRSVAWLLKVGLLARV